MTSTASAVSTGGCLVLVDYDNAFPPNAALSDQEIVQEMERWLRLLSDRYRDAATYEVRLYGGWYDESDLSRHGSEVARLLPLMPEFPMRVPDGRILRGTITLAVTPMASRDSSPLLGTYRRRGSLPRIRLTREPYPEFCARQDQQCPAAILRSFTKHARRSCPAEACGIVSADAFVIHEQKMVDTMLASDVLTVARSLKTLSAIVVVSGDSDFVPALLAARSFGMSELVQLRPRNHEASSYATTVLAQAGVKVI